MIFILAMPYEGDNCGKSFTTKLTSNIIMAFFGVIMTT